MTVRLWRLDLWCFYVLITVPHWACSLVFLHVCTLILILILILIYIATHACLACVQHAYSASVWQIQHNYFVAVYFSGWTTQWGIMAEQDAESFAGEDDVQLLKFPNPTPKMVYCKRQLKTSWHHGHITLIAQCCSDMGSSIYSGVCNLCLLHLHAQLHHNRYMARPPCSLLWTLELLPPHQLLCFLKLCLAS